MKTINIYQPSLGKEELNAIKESKTNLSQEEQIHLLEKLKEKHSG